MSDKSLYQTVRTFGLLVCLLGVSAPALSEPLTGRAAGSVPKGSIWEEHWLFRKSILMASPEVDFEYYLYGELGNEENMVNSLRRDRVQISSSSLWGLSSTIPEAAVLSLPYLFESAEEADFSTTVAPQISSAPIWNRLAWPFSDGRKRGGQGSTAPSPI